MLLPALAATALLVTAPAGFDAAKAKAKPVESLKKTVAALVGDCSGADFETAIECEANLKQRAKAIRGDDTYLWLGTPDGELVRYEGMRGDKARIVLTAMFDAGGGHALTFRKPLRLDKKSGTPLVKVTVIDAKLAPGVLEGDLKRAMRLGMLGVEVVGRFGSTWSLKSGGKVVQGVTFDAKAIRLINARNGKAILEADL